jgi:hypothetical protein
LTFRSVAVLKDIVRPLIPSFLRPHRLAYNRILRYSQGKIVSGPFAGQIHLTNEVDFVVPAMLMGSYEKELYPVIEEVLANPPKVFIDIGAAQGYFAIGFAKCAPASRHVGFELFEPSVKQLKRTAAANGVSIDVRGQCTTELLNDVLEDRSFVMCDVEGYEIELIDPIKSPLLKTAVMIVETHERVFGGYTIEDLIERFKATHSIQVIDTRKRTYDDLPFRIKDPWTLKQVDERRSGPQSWLFLKPLEAAGARDMVDSKKP